MHKSEYVFENQTHLIIWNFEILKKSPKPGNNTTPRKKNLYGGRFCPGWSRNENQRNRNDWQNILALPENWKNKQTVEQEDDKHTN